MEHTIKKDVLALYKSHPFPRWNHGERQHRLSAELCRYRFLGLEDAMKDARFLDIGCGKGGVIFLASDIFNNAIGVERNKKCYEVCLDNLKELKNCKIYNLDANDFNDYENIDFVYMYNPFGNKTMKSVLDNINKSRINKPRDVLILYKNPIENDLLLENGFVCISTHNDHTREDNMVSKLYKKDYGNVS